MNVRTIFFFRKINLGSTNSKNEVKIFSLYSKWVTFTRFAVKKEKNHLFFFLKRMDILKKRPSILLSKHSPFFHNMKRTLFFLIQKEGQKRLLVVVAMFFDKKALKRSICKSSNVLENIIKIFPVFHSATLGILH